jgi:tetratricopeptide (TPR) repeat protein
MKAVRFILAAACLATASVRADINTDNIGPAPAASAMPPREASPATADTSSSSSSTTDPAKIADFERRFAQGRQLEQQGKLADARAVFDGILAEAPDAKGSLAEAGHISVQLRDYVNADRYLSKLLALVPDYPPAIEQLIPVSQTLKHDAKAEILIKKFRDLYTTGKLQEFHTLHEPDNPLEPYFVRELIHLDDGREIVITQFFDYHQPRYYAWAAELFDASHNVKRRLTVNYDPNVTASLRAKDPTLAHAEQFLLVDNVIAGDKVARLDVYQQFLALPDYTKMRTILLEVFANALKPIDSAPIPQNPS